MNEDGEFAELNLPRLVLARARKLLWAITAASTVADALHAADRAEGFALGIETVKALDAGVIEGLYLIFDRALQARQRELKDDRRRHS